MKTIISSVAELNAFSYLVQTTTEQCLFGRAENIAEIEKESIKNIVALATGYKNIQDLENTLTLYIRQFNLCDLKEQIASTIDKHFTNETIIYCLKLGFQISIEELLQTFQITISSELVNLPEEVTIHEISSGHISINLQSGMASIKNDNDSKPNEIVVCFEQNIRIKDVIKQLNSSETNLLFRQLKGLRPSTLIEEIESYELCAPYPLRLDFYDKPTQQFMLAIYKFNQSIVGINSIKVIKNLQEIPRLKAFMWGAFNSTLDEAFKSFQNIVEKEYRLLNINKFDYIRMAYFYLFEEDYNFNKKEYKFELPHTAIEIIKKPDVFDAALKGILDALDVRETSEPCNINTTSNSISFNINEKRHPIRIVINIRASESYIIWKHYLIDGESHYDYILEGIYEDYNSANQAAIQQLDALNKGDFELIIIKSDEYMDAFALENYGNNKQISSMVNNLDYKKNVILFPDYPLKSFRRPATLSK